MKRILRILRVGPAAWVARAAAWPRRKALFLLFLLFLLILSVLLGALSCDPLNSATPDTRALDLLLPPSDGLSQAETGKVSWVDFLVQGCNARTPDACQGSIPLKLTFSAVLQEKGLSGTWNFGDGSPVATGIVIEHTYTNIGVFTVTLSIGSSSGTVSEQKIDFVIADAAGAGAPCAKDSSCLSGKCLCQTACDFPLESGLCLEDCTIWPCQSSDTVCINLSLYETGEMAPALDPWRTHLCLPSCKIEGDCQREGFFCQLAPGTSGWHNACLPPFLRFIGAPCRDTAGIPDPNLCLGGQCMDLGASGYCSANCGEGGCPAGSRCARFVELDNQTVCLLQCEEGGCMGDPWLACEEPDTSGHYGFEILGPSDPSGVTYCSAKRCLEDEECGLFGRCDHALGGFCVSP